MPETLSDEEQQLLIAQKLGMEEDTAFGRFLAASWPDFEFWTNLPAGAQLRRLYVTREGILWLLGRSWKYRDIKLGDVQRKDSQVVKNLTMMLAAIQDDINVITNRTQSRPATGSAIVAGSIIRGAPGDPTRGTT